MKNIPNDLVAEQSVLGAAFLSTAALQKIVETVDEDYFYVDRHKKIFNAIKELSEAKKPLDITTVTSKLSDNKHLTEIGGVEYLTEILETVPTAANVEYYIEILENNQIRRNVIEAGTDIVNIAYQTDLTTNETLEEAERKIFQVLKNRKASDIKTIKEVLEKTQEHLERLSSNKSDVTGLSTGWPAIDRITSGLHPNELTIIAARPGIGKTALALNLTTYVAMNYDKQVALFNMEMGAEQLAQRMLSSLGNIDSFKMRTGNLLNEDWKKLTEAFSQLGEANLFIDDTPGMTIGEIRAKCRRIASSKEGLALVVIDYLQLISGSNKYAGNRQQEVSEISRSLKTMAMELKVPVIALAQLSRSVDSREDKRPLLSDLRESGSLEQDADVVAFLYREDYYNKESRTDNSNSKTEYIIAKHRNGPTATVELLFKKDTSSFLSYKKEYDSKEGSNE